MFSTISMTLSLAACMGVRYRLACLECLVVRPTPAKSYGLLMTASILPLGLAAPQNQVRQVYGILAIL